MTFGRRCLVAGVVMLCAQVLMRADTLVMRSGERVDGQLLGIRDGIVEFEARGRGVFGGGRERLRIEREEVQRIEFDDRRREGANFDRDDDRDDGRDRLDGRDDDRPRDRPSGLRERDVSVEASVPWKDTGIDVRAGQTVYFSASGRVRWGPGRQDGAAGERNSPRNDSRPMPSRSAAGLIGRIGGGNDYFFIGDEQGAIRMRSSGRLYLGINDGYLDDNSGSFRVTVYY